MKVLNNEIHTLFRNMEGLLEVSIFIFLLVDLFKPLSLNSQEAHMNTPPNPS